MAGPSVTYTFSNSTTADATQVNQNFTDLINGATDGTKDYSINALTCAGAATLNGNVTLGNASGDTLTVNASLASSIAINTTNSYDIGSSTVGLQSIYFGSSGGAFTTRLIGGAAGASWTLTLPTAVPSNAKSVMVFSTSGTASFEHRSIQTVTSIDNGDSPYTALASDQVVLCDTTSGAITVNLPAASSSTGKSFHFKNTATSNAITLDGNSSETIDGSTTLVLSPLDAVTLICDGTGWYAL